MAYVLWALVGLALIAAEMAVGTFHLLVLGLAALCVAGAAYLFEVPTVTQFVLASGIAVAGVLLVEILRKRRRLDQSDGRDPDRGNPVEVRNLSPLRVQYRGALWAAELEQQDVNLQLPLYVAAIRDNTVFLSNKRHA